MSTKGEATQNTPGAPGETRLNHVSTPLSALEVIPPTVQKFFENLSKQIAISQQQVFDLEEAASYCRVETKTIQYHALRSKKLAYVRIAKDRLTFLKSDLDDFLSASRT